MLRFALFAALQFQRTFLVLRLSFFLLALMFSSSLCIGQAATGTPNFSAFDSYQFDTVDLMSNTIVLNIPVRSKAGALPFNLNLSANSGMFAETLNGTLEWMPMMYDINPNIIFAGEPFVRNVNGVGLDSASGVDAGSMLRDVAVYTVTLGGQTCGGHSGITQYRNWVLVTGRGTVHPLPTSDYIDSSNASGCHTTFTDQTTDDSGWTVTVAQDVIGSTVIPIATSITRSDGMSVVLGTSVPTINKLVDRNGNSIEESIGSSTYTFTDSMGQTAVTYTPLSNTYAWTDFSQGTTVPTLTQNTSASKLKTTFGCGTGFPADLNTTSMYALTSGFSFPDGTSLGISYESVGTGTVTGRVQQLTLPTGGTIKYTYGGSNNGLNCTTQTVPILTRTLGNGDVTSYNLSYTSTYAVNTVGDPSNNSSQYYFGGFNSNGPVQGMPQFLEEVVRYQNEFPRGNPVVQSTDVYCYNQNATPDLCLGVINAGNQLAQSYTFPITARVHMRQMGQGNWSATVESYDKYGNTTAKATYDYTSSNFAGTQPLKSNTVTYGSWNGTNAHQTQAVMQSSFKPRPPSFIEEIQRDLRATTMQARHIIFMGYSLPQDDVTYRAFFSASRQRSRSCHEQPVQCTVVGLERTSPHWCGPVVSDKLQVDTVKAAIDIFGAGNVRFFGGGIPDVFLDGGQVTEGVLHKLLDWSSIP